MANPNQQSKAMQPFILEQLLNHGMQLWSNQGEVWDSVEELHALSGTVSNTRAMRDTFE